MPLNKIIVLRQLDGIRRIVGRSDDIPDFKDGFAARVTDSDGLVAELERKEAHYVLYREVAPVVSQEDGA